MQLVDRDFGDELSDPIDRLLISLRAYVTRAPRKPKKGEKADKAKARWRDPRDYYPHNPPSDWVLVFDCETRTTPDQRLRFGAYQLRYKGQLWERGAIYEPERAQYPESDVTTIGLNFLTACEPIWFTLADVLASKILTGHTPKVLSTHCFEAMEKQENLLSIEVAGTRIDPATHDFYQHLIMHRNVLKAKLKTATDADKPELKSDQQGVPCQCHQLWNFC